jgi:hypothetical protein
MTLAPPSSLSPVQEEGFRWSSRYKLNWLPTRMCLARVTPHFGALHAPALPVVHQNLVLVLHYYIGAYWPMWPRLAWRTKL